ncbi:MAG: hypothetical protein A3C46_04460 [Deltaproteobacteria bacterium RIFCSPHIGHO2_02_FULL_44_16]|nr:MAG: hypothetical protein A3C46_04460 [Deltaproteobacteria bacterium RIFCSPHIGHO2_02_FULL_44_16]
MTDPFPVLKSEATSLTPSAHKPTHACFVVGFAITNLGKTSSVEHALVLRSLRALHVLPSATEEKDGVRRVDFGTSIPRGAIAMLVWNGKNGKQLYGSECDSPSPDKVEAFLDAKTEIARIMIQDVRRFCGAHCAEPIEQYQ